MINFASLFNQFRSQPNNGLADLLEQSNIKMGKILDEETFINEYKSANPRTIEFMKYGRYLELVEFVTVVGDANDKKRSFKYPLSACDVLSIDNNTAIQFFLPERQLTTDIKVTQDVQVDVEVEIQQDIPAPQPQNQPKQPAPEVSEDPIQLLANTDQPAQSVKAVEGQNKQQAAQINQEKVGNQATTSEEPEVPKVEEVVVQKVTRKIIKKQIQKVQKIVKQELEPLIYKLLAYFEGEVNYTLAGYVSKILTYFFTKRPAELLKYIFQEGMIDKILNHAESRSVGDFIVKILTTESNIFLEKRGEMFKQLLARLSSSFEVCVMSNLSAYASQVIEKIAANLKSNNKVLEFNNTFFSLEIVTEVIKNVMKDEQNVSIYNAPILFTYLTNVPFVLPEDETVISDFKALLENFIDKSCLKLQVENQSRPKLGVGRIKIVEILRFILKENILNSKQIVGRKTQFFPILYNLIKQYDMNNLLHNQIIKIIDIALQQPEDSSINKLILLDSTLLDFIVFEAKEDVKIRAGNSVYKTRKGYIAHLINLCIKLRQLSEKNSNIKTLTENPQFSSLFETFIEKEIFNTKKTLAGYAMRKDLKHEIMFQKDEILSSYLTFFQKCPTAVFQAQPQHINIQHPDLVEELQKQLQQNLTVKPKDQKQQQQRQQQDTDDKMPSEDGVTEAESISPPDFWVVHLGYDVNDLIANL